MEALDPRQTAIEQLRHAILKVADHAAIVAILYKTPENKALSHYLTDLNSALASARAARHLYAAIAKSREVSVPAFGVHYASATEAIVIVGRGLALGGGLVGSFVPRSTDPTNEEITETFSSLKAMAIQEFARLDGTSEPKPTLGLTTGELREIVRNKLGRRLGRNTILKWLKQAGLEPLDAKSRRPRYRTAECCRVLRDHGIDLPD